MSTEVPHPPMRQKAGLKKTGLEKVWVVIVVVSWLLVTAALAAAAVTGRNIGKPTWWLGTASDPASLLLWVVPFLAPIAVIVCAIVVGRWAPFAGVGASLYLGAVATLDLESTPAVALIQVAVACAAFLISIASLAGRNR